MNGILSAIQNAATPAGPAGLNVNIEHSFQSLSLRLIAMEGMYAGFAGAKTGYCRMQLRVCFIFLATRNPS